MVNKTFFPALVVLVGDCGIKKCEMAFKHLLSPLSNHFVLFVIKIDFFLRNRIIHDLFINKLHIIINQV